MNSQTHNTEIQSSQNSNLSSMEDSGNSPTTCLFTVEKTERYFGLILLCALSGGLGGWSALYEEMPQTSGEELFEAFIIGMAASFFAAIVIAVPIYLITHFHRQKT